MRDFVVVVLIIGLLALCTLSPRPALAASNYTLDNAALSAGEFFPPVWYFKDDTEKSSLEQVQAQFVQNGFRRAGPNFNAGISQPVHWFKVLVEIANDFDKHQNPMLYLEIIDPIIDRIELYQFINGQPQPVVVMGGKLPFSARPFPAPNFVIPIQASAGDVHEFWLRIETAHSMHLPVRVVSPEVFTSHQNGNALFYGALMGLSGIMVIYNAMMGWRVQSISYLYYVGVLFSGALHRLHASGLGYEYFWPDLPELNLYIRPLMDNSISLFSLLFTQHFLMTRSFAPLLHKCLSVLVVVSLVAIVLVFVLPEKVALYIALWVLLVAFLVQYAVGIDCWLNKMRHAKLFLLGWFVFLGGGIILVFASLGALPLNNITIHAAEVGLAIQVLALSVALSDRISHIQQETIDAQQRNVENMTRYRELYENSRDGLFEMLPDGRVLHMNPAFAGLLNVAPKSLGDHDFWSFFSSVETREHTRKQIQSGRQVVGLESQIRTGTGKEIWASLSLQVTEKDGQSVCDGVLRDISASKAREEAERAQRQAEAATSAKSAFLANMSHEIRTPLTAIIGFAEDARDNKLQPEEMRACIDTVVSSSYHLLDIINDVLDLSKIEAGKLELEQIRIDVAELLRDIDSVFAKRIEAKGLQFKLDAQLPLPRFIQSDPTRLKQIILNLLGNALKFTRQGSITLRLQFLPAEDRLQLAVIDTGIGISREQQQKIFQAFSQADISTARNFGGTGLGLSIVIQLLDLMGGQIQVQSEVERGATFVVEIPAHTEPRAEMITAIEQLETVAKAASAKLIPQLQGQVLYAEDNPVNQVLVRNLVHRTGASIDTVQNGAEAMLYALERKPDVILMDISMPVISGMTATRLLRSYGYQGAIVACTANVMATEVDLYRESGFDAFLEKPIHRARFFKVLERFCQAREPGGRVSGAESD